MSSILKVDQLQDSGGNEIITSNGSGTITVNNQTFKNGITMADQWRLTTNTNQGVDGDISSNWERVDSDGFNYIGTGLTESSGIFSFPSTGIYLINFNGRLTVDNGDTTANITLQTTEDNSNYGTAANASSGNTGTSNISATATANFIFDVTNITTHKFKFQSNSFGTATSVNGGTNDNRTHVTVIRLGDT